MSPERHSFVFAPMGTIPGEYSCEGANLSPQPWRPVPAPGVPHRYVFRLAALDTHLSADTRTRCAKIDALAKGHVLAETWPGGQFDR